MRSLFVVVLLLAPVLSAETVRGRAFFDNSPLPGCTVTLSAGDDIRRQVSDAKGRYSFTAVPPGPYMLTVTLEGLGTETREITVREEEPLGVDVELRANPDPRTTTVTFTCGSSVPFCGEDHPATPFDLPVCAEYELNSTLIESLGHGDASVIDLLRSRYTTAFTYSERHRIAGALLGRVADDRAYWNELAGHAADALRFAHVDDEPPQEFLDWCEARRVDPTEYRWMTIQALTAAAADRRSRRLLLEALESKDQHIVYTALVMLPTHRDDSVLPNIEKALRRTPGHSEDLAMLLATFRSDAADELAKKFVSVERRAEYAEQRRQAECETIGCEP